MLIDQVKLDLKQATFDKDEVKLLTLRMLLSEAKYAQIATRKEGEFSDNISDDQLLSVIQKEVKKRKEAITSFRQGQREDLAQKEAAELQVLEKYRPTQMPQEELVKIIDDAIQQTGATNIQDMGKVMSAVMSQVGARADGSRVSSLVKTRVLL